jgi:hypothetical protein
MRKCFLVENGVLLYRDFKGKKKLYLCIEYLTRHLVSRRRDEMKLCRLHIVPFLILFIIGTFITVEAVDAPYITGVWQSGNQLVVSWINYDKTTEKFLLLRKTAATSFMCIDTLPDSVAQYTDSAAGLHRRRARESPE